MFKKFNILISFYLKNKKKKEKCDSHSQSFFYSWSRDPVHSFKRRVIFEREALQGPKNHPLKGSRREMNFLHQVVRGEYMFFLIFLYTKRSFLIGHFPCLTINSFAGLVKNQFKQCLHMKQPCILNNFMSKMPLKPLI